VKIFDEKYIMATKHWDVLAYLIHEDGTKELIRAIDHNLVVEQISVAIACLMKSQAGYSGLLYWAVGSGLETWSDDDPPDPVETDSMLAAETYRKAITSADMIFIDANNIESVTPTNRIQVTVTFGSAEANGKLKEFGLFAGTATAVSNTGLMINHKTHQLITKTSIVELAYTLRLTF